jgi:hypothetical protein
MDFLKAGFAGGFGAVLIMGGYVLMQGAAVPTLSQSASAAVPEVAALRLDFGKNLSAAQCGGVGSPVINASQKVVNTVDSGEAGNYWAFDQFSRTIQVWKTETENTYCALVSYRGNFSGVSGQTSPGNTGVLSGNERGPMQGGYAATIVGTLLTNPAWNANGGVGTTNYQCDISGTCPGSINWVTQYFNSDYTFTYNWWGWIYRGGGKDKAWVNSSEGNTGDVI